MEQDPSEPLVLTASRRRLAILLVAFILFALGGCWMIATGERLWGWVAALLFGAGVPFALWNLARPGSIHLEREGFQVKGVGRGGFSSRWEECDGFRAFSAAPGSPLVLFDWTPASTRSGFGALPDTYGMGANDLAILMQTWRDRAVGAAAGGHATEPV